MKAITLSLLLLIISFITYAQKKVSGILQPGKDYWLAAVDFNSTYNLNPGDTVLLSAGKYKTIEMGKVNGIVFQNQGLVELSNWNIYNGGQSIQLLGNGTPSLKYGIRIKGSGFAINWESVGNNKIKYVEIDGNAMGIKISTKPNEPYPLTYQNIEIESCFIKNVSQEAMYIGRDELGGPFITWNIRNNILRNTGRDGIQCRNGTGIIEANDLDSIGMANSDMHTHGILIGGNTKNGAITKNVVRNTPYGYGIFVNGYGDFIISDNDISSGNSAIFTKNYPISEDLQKVGYQKVDITNNKLAGPLALQSYDNNDVINVTIMYYNNTTKAKTEVQNGISFRTSPIITTPTEPTTPTIPTTPITEVATVQETKIGAYNAMVYKPAMTKTEKRNALVFFPGQGEYGTAISKLYVHGPAKYIKEGWRPDFMVIAIQGNTTSFIEAPNVETTLAAILKQYPVDSLILTGLSAGGWSINNYIMKPGTFPSRAKIKAAVVMSATQQAGTYDNFKNIKYWGLSGKTDDYTADFKKMVNALIAKGYNAQFTEYAGGHCCWNIYYNPTWKENGKSIYDWNRTITPPTPPKEYKNAEVKQEFTKGNCSADSVGSRVSFTVVAGKYTSITSQAEADQKALTEISQLGQAYADRSGICLPIQKKVTIQLADGNKETATFELRKGIWVWIK